MGGIKIAIVGATGAVGQELVDLIKKRSFLYEELRLFDSKKAPVFDGVDLAFFCVTDPIAKKWVPIAREKGAICIDLSTTYRSDPDIPLVIPEINGHLLQSDQGIISSPNCSTTLMILPIHLLHRSFQIKRIIASTYQAVSGAGIKAMEELKTQSKAYLADLPLESEAFPYPIAFNLFPHESEMDDSDYVAEERKMKEETKKILEDSSIEVSPTCVRVPIFRAHSLALNIEFRDPIAKEEAIHLIKQTPGVQFWEERPPMPIDASGQNPVMCGRVRMDSSNPHSLEMWIVGDQLLKGAALNMIQIAEKLNVYNH